MSIVTSLVLVMRSQISKVGNPTISIFKCSSVVCNLHGIIIPLPNNHDFVIAKGHIKPTLQRYDISDIVQIMRIINGRFYLLVIPYHISF